jgi:hypothetical protein
MVELDQVRSANSALVQRQPIVAVFFGGTGGIGSYTIRALADIEAKNQGKGLRAYIIGRKAKSGNEFVAECRTTYPSGDFKFIQAGDMSLMTGVDQACADLIKAEEQHGDEARIDYLMLGQGGVPYKPRQGEVCPRPVLLLITWLCGRLQQGLTSSDSWST